MIPERVGDAFAAQAKSGFEPQTLICLGQDVIATPTGKAIGHEFIRHRSLGAVSIGLGSLRRLGMHFRFVCAAEGPQFDRCGAPS